MNKKLKKENRKILINIILIILRAWVIPTVA